DVVRAPPPARLQGRQELRRLVDRVGQPGRRADRAVGMRPEDQTTRREEIAGWAITIDTYKLGGVYHCTIANVDPGARLARAEGATKEEAESRAIEKATRYLAQTRKF